PGRADSPNGDGLSVRAARSLCSVRCSLYPVTPRRQAWWQTPKRGVARTATPPGTKALAPTPKPSRRQNRSGLSGRTTPAHACRAGDSYFPGSAATARPEKRCLPSARCDGDASQGRDIADQPEVGAAQGKLLRCATHRGQVSGSIPLG